MILHICLSVFFLCLPFFFFCFALALSLSILKFWSWKKKLLNFCFFFLSFSFVLEDFIRWEMVESHRKIKCWRSRVTLQLFILLWFQDQAQDIREYVLCLVVLMWTADLMWPLYKLNGLCKFGVRKRNLMHFYITDNYYVTFH